MVNAVIFCAWVEPDLKGDSDLTQSRHPTVMDDHPPLRWVDVTAQPAETMPGEHPYVVIQGTWDDAAWDKLLADDRYGANCVIKADKPVTAPATAFDIPAAVKQGSDLKTGDSPDQMASKLVTFLANQAKTDIAVSATPDGP